jgi:hypothetical protein
MKSSMVALAVIVAVLVTAAVSSASSKHGSLTGTWSGYMNRAYGAGTQTKRHRLTIVVNASERGGSWKVSNSCRGPLKLQSISDGFHHYTEELTKGSKCAGGGVDCLERAGAALYDEFQSAPGTQYVSDGTLRRVTTP